MKMKLQYNDRRKIYFETKRNGGNDDQNIINKVKIKPVDVGYKVYESSSLFKPWGFNVFARYAALHLLNKF